MDVVMLASSPGTLKKTQNIPESRGHGPPEDDWVTEGPASPRKTGEAPSFDLVPTFPGSLQGPLTSEEMQSSQDGKMAGCLAG